MTQLDGLKWHAHARVDKYDDEQVEWVAAQSGVLVPQGDLLSQYVKPYEVTEADGNLLTTAGLTRIMSLIVGGGGTALTNTATRLGVGNSATAATIGDTDLGAASGSGNRYFMTMDSTYPSASGAVVTAKATFATGDGNFAWAEWAIDVKNSGSATAGTTVNECLVNHKIVSLGTKVSGAWSLTVTISLS